MMKTSKKFLKVSVFLSVMASYLGVTFPSVAQGPFDKDSYGAAIEECGGQIKFDGDFESDEASISADDMVRNFTPYFMEVPAEERGPIIKFYLECLKLTLTATEHTEVLDVYRTFANEISSSATAYGEPLDQKSADIFSNMVLARISPVYYPFIKEVSVALGGGYRETNLSSTLDMQKCNGHFSGQIVQAETDATVTIDIANGAPISVVTRAVQLECGSVDGPRLTKDLANLAIENSGCLLETRLGGAYPSRAASSINIPAKSPLVISERDMTRFLSACP